MATEPIPVDAIMTDFNSQWNASNVTKPSFITVNGASQPFRFDLNVGDHLIGRPGSPAMREDAIGNWKYGNKTYSVELELYTLNSKQRLYDLMLEVRRLCHNRMTSLTNYQRIQFLNFNEEASDQANVWTGSIEIELVNNGVLLET